MVVRLYRKIIIAALLGIIILSLYDVLFQLLYELFDTLFEAVEHFLDVVVEHLFDTGTHDTQIIVFYVLSPLICYGLYKLYLWLSHRFMRLKTSLIADKEEFLACWRQFPLLKKMQWWTFFLITVIGLLMYYGFM